MTATPRQSDRASPTPVGAVSTRQPKPQASTPAPDLPAPRPAAPQPSVPQVSAPQIPAPRPPADSQPPAASRPPSTGARPRAAALRARIVAEISLGTLWRKHRVFTIAFVLSLLPRILELLSFRPALLTADSFVYMQEAVNHQLGTIRPS